MRLKDWDKVFRWLHCYFFPIFCSAFERTYLKYKYLTFMFLIPSNIFLFIVLFQYNPGEKMAGLPSFDRLNGGSSWLMACNKQLNQDPGYLYSRIVFFHLDEKQLSKKWSMNARHYYQLYILWCREYIDESKIRTIYLAITNSKSWSYLCGKNMWSHVTGQPCPGGSQGPIISECRAESTTLQKF